MAGEVVHIVSEPVAATIEPVADTVHEHSHELHEELRVQQERHEAVWQTRIESQLEHLNSLTEQLHQLQTEHLSSSHSVSEATQEAEAVVSEARDDLAAVVEEAVNPVDPEPDTIAKGSDLAVVSQPPPEEETGPRPSERRRPRGLRRR